MTMTTMFDCSGSNLVDAIGDTDPGRWLTAGPGAA